MNNGGGGLPSGGYYRHGGHHSRDGFGRDRDGGGYNRDRDGGGFNRDRDAGYHNKNNLSRDRDNNGRREQYQPTVPQLLELRNRGSDFYPKRPYHNNGKAFEQRQYPFDAHIDSDRVMAGSRRAWIGAPMHNQMPPGGQMQNMRPRSASNVVSNTNKDDTDCEKPEVGSKLAENSVDDDNVSYVAAGTAPVSRFQKEMSPHKKSASPVPMSLVTNYAGQVLTRAAHQPSFEEQQQFDRRSPYGYEQNPRFGNNDGRLSRNGRDSRESGHHGSGPLPRHDPGHYMHNQSNAQVLNDLAQIRFLQQMQKQLLGGQDVQMMLPRLTQDKQNLMLQLLHQLNGLILRKPNEENRRTYPGGRQMPRSPDGELSAQRLLAGDMTSISSEEAIPLLVKLIQQQARECSPGDPNEEMGHSALSSWPKVDTDSSGHVTPSPTPVSPTKQNYSAVVSRASRSSTSDPPKEGPILYSTKVAATVPAPPTAPFEPRKGSSRQFKDHLGNPILPVSTAAAATAASISPRNENALLAAQILTPCPPPPTTPVDGKTKIVLSKVDELSQEIWKYHNSVTQTEAMLTRKLNLRDMLFHTIYPVFPRCGLYVVGSSLNGFGNNSSDMDLCLMLTNKDLDQKTDAVLVLKMVLTTLTQLEWVDTQHLILAKVPILRIRFKAPWEDITVDLNVNNSVAIRNTNLLCYYSSFDWRVRPLVSIVKGWAKKKGINDANRSSFTSYSLVLMVIHYLQCGVNSAVLPSLQAMFPSRFDTRVDVRALNSTQKLSPSAAKWMHSDKATLGELFIGFLDYYANKFDYDCDAISVRQGRRVDRASIAVKRPQNATGCPSNNSWRSQWRCICIEEPFTLSNTAHSIYDEMVFGAIKCAFREAHDELEKNMDIQSLLDCNPISVVPQHNGAMVFHFDNSGSASSAEALKSNSENSLTATTTRSASTNSVGSDDSGKSPAQAFDRSQRKGSWKRGGGPNRGHKQQPARKSSSGHGSSAPAPSPISC